jgi:hypothetical protein
MEAIVVGFMLGWEGIGAGCGECKLEEAQDREADA